MAAVARAGTVIAAGVVAVAIGSPASANVRHFADQRNDTSTTLDLRTVTVDNSTRHPDKVIVVARQEEVRNGDEIVIYLDTKRANPGPEFLIGGMYGSEYGMTHMRGWTVTGDFIPFECGYRLKATFFRVSDSIRAAIPRDCLGNPGLVRVAVRAERGSAATSRDWAKGYREWFGWVAR